MTLSPDLFLRGALIGIGGAALMDVFLSALLLAGVARSA